MAIPSYDRIYEAVRRERDRLERSKLLYLDCFDDPTNGSLNAAAAMQRQMLEQQQQQKTRGSRETTRRNSLLLLTKKGR